MEKKILKLFLVNLNAVFSNIIFPHLKVNTTPNRRASLVAQDVKNPPASTGDWGLIPGSRRNPGEGNGNPLQYSCLGNPVDREA